MDAPRVSPAMSKTVRLAGTRDFGLNLSLSQSKRASGTMTRASSGSMVAYGKFYSLRQQGFNGLDFQERRVSSYRRIA